MADSSEKKSKKDRKDKKDKDKKRKRSEAVAEETPSNGTDHSVDNSAPSPKRVKKSESEYTCCMFNISRSTHPCSDPISPPSRQPSRMRLWQAIWPLIASLFLVIIATINHLLPFRILNFPPMLWPRRRSTPPPPPSKPCAGPLFFQTVILSELPKRTLIFPHWLLYSDNGCDCSGSGKTLAFSLPLMNSLKQMSHAKSPLVLVLAPTRELAKQISDVCTEVGNASGLKVPISFFSLFFSSSFLAAADDVNIFLYHDNIIF